MFLHYLVNDLCKSFVGSYHLLSGNCDNLLLRSVIKSHCRSLNLNEEVALSQTLPFLVDALDNFA